jgi:high-affinity nickel-transport protein
LLLGVLGRLDHGRTELRIAGGSDAIAITVGCGLLYAAHLLLSSHVYPWIAILAGLGLVLLGGYMLLQRFAGQAVAHRHPAGELHAHWLGSLASKAPRAASLGKTRGLMPYPAAAAILLSALALPRLQAGLLMIAAFCLGLAGAAFAPPRRGTGTRWFLAASPAAIAALGLMMALRGFFSLGLVWHRLTQEKVGPALFVAGLGLILGIRHSTDADHVVAISTIVTRQRSMRGAALIGTLWGLGHTITIFIVGCLIILGGVVIPPRIGLSMEFSVGLMLILLGVLNLTGVMGRLVARLTPESRRGAFSEARSKPRLGIRAASAVEQHGVYQLLRPLAIGLVHGLAGSAAVALLVLSTIHNPIWAIGYLVIFGAGTMFGMMCMTAAMSLSLAYAGDRLPQVGRYLGVASGLVSVCFGMFLIYQLGIGDGLFTGHPHWTPQ